MAEFEATGSVTRTELNLGPLAITPEDGYYIQRDGFGPGERTWRRISAESPYVHGSFLTHAVIDQEISTLKIRVAGTTELQMTQRINALIAALTQFSYTLTIDIGETFHYVLSCEPADYTIGDGGSVQDMWLRNRTQILTFDIPHRPSF